MKMFFRLIVVQIILYLYLAKSPKWKWTRIRTLMIQNKLGKSHYLCLNFFANWPRVIIVYVLAHRELESTTNATYEVKLKISSAHMDNLVPAMCKVRYVSLCSLLLFPIYLPACILYRVLVNYNRRLQVMGCIVPETEVMRNYFGWQENLWEKKWRDQAISPSLKGCFSVY